MLPPFHIRYIKFVPALPPARGEDPPPLGDPAPTFVALAAGPTNNNNFGYTDY